MSGPASPLDLWHPTAERAEVVVGGESLADIPPGEVAWLLLPPGRRRAAERALARHGLAVLDEVVAIPSWDEPHHLLPLSPALADAGTHHLGWSHARSRAVAAALRLPPARLLLRRRLRHCGFVVGRPGIVPMRWLRELGGGKDAHVRVEPTGAGRVAIVTAGDLVVKAGLDAAGRERAARERRALEELREAAAAAGADVPTVVASGPWFVAETAVAGRPPRAHELERVTNDVVRWLAAWNAATAHRGEPDLSGLVRTAERLDVPAEYLEWLAALVTRLRGRPLLRVAAHNDLTMANVLVSPQRIAIVDWESARADGDPLHDLWYALADAGSRARRIPHAEAVEALVAEGAPQVAAAAARLSLSEDEALLAFHGCWLAHAADELDRGGPGAFAGVVRRVAALPAARTPFRRPSP